MYLLFCQFCGYKRIASSNEEIKLTPVTLCKGGGKLNEGGARGEKVSQKFKCPKCGRVISTQSAIPPEKEDIKKTKDFETLF